MELICVHPYQKTVPAICVPNGTAVSTDVSSGHRLWESRSCPLQVILPVQWAGFAVYYYGIPIACLIRIINNPNPAMDSLGLLLHARCIPSTFQYQESI
jgi:hypothetical protein